MQSSFVDFPLFVGASLALILTPGPDMLYVLARGVSQGRLAGVISALGICSGLIVHTLAATFGLAVLLQTSSTAYFTVKYLGAVYLVYIGWKKITGSREGISYNVNGHRSYDRLYLKGLLTNVLNPKVALFFLSFLPQFVNSRSPWMTLQSLGLGLTYFLLSLAVLLGVALLAGKLGGFLAGEKPRVRIGRFTGSVFIGLGLYLALPGRS